MDIRDFMDVSKLQELQDKFSNATGLAVAAVNLNGEYITEPSNFTDFCMKYTRGSAEGARRCKKCDTDNTGVYSCHCGLMDFSIDLTVSGRLIVALE